MKKKIVKILFLIFIIMLNVINVVYAAPADIYNIGNNKLQTAGTYVAGIIKYAAIVIGVVVLMLKGIKFITASPEGKADAKKELIPWFIGLIILFAMIPFLNWIIDLSKNNINNITTDDIGKVNNVIENVIRI